MNVIFLTVDTLKSKPVIENSIPTPNIDFLSGKSTVFRNHYVTSPHTGPSFASIFTGAYPNEHGYFSNKRNVSNETVDTNSIFDCRDQFTRLLKENSYTTFCVQGNDGYCGKKSGFDDYFDDYVTDFYQGTSGGLKDIFKSISGSIGLYDILKKNYIRLRNQFVKEKRFFTQNSKKADVLTDCAISKLKSCSGKKFFLWVNYIDPHSPYEDIYNLASNMPYDSIENKKPELFNLKYNLENELTSLEKSFVIEKYNNEVSFVDSQIGRLIQYMKNKDFLKDTALIFTSDHGEEFWEHGGDRQDPSYYNRGVDHGHTLYEELTRVPLFVYIPNKESAKLNYLTSSVNLFNTFLELAGIDPVDYIPPSLNKIACGEESMEYSVSEYLMYGTERKSIVTSEGMKLIKNVEESEYELYDLKKDPTEKDDISEVNSCLVDELSSKISFVTKDKIPYVGGESVYESLMVERLKALGYM